MMRKTLTTVEICILLSIVLIVAAVFFIVIDPASKQAAARNAQRWNDVALLMEGMQNAFAETHGELSGDLAPVDTDAATVQMIVNGDMGATCGNVCGVERIAQTDCTVNAAPLVANGYIAAVPGDPAADAGSGTGYYVNYDDGVFTVGACSAEQERNGATPNIRIAR